MPLYLYRRGRVWYVRGTVRGQRVNETTGVAEEATAEEIRAKREWELIQTSIHGRAVSGTFVKAAVAYLEAGGERRFIEPLSQHFGLTALTKIDQAAIDRAAARLYPGRSPATLNRQVYTPMSAIMRTAAALGMVEPRTIRRPKQPAGKMRWLTPEEAAALVDAAAPHLRPLIVFLLYTGARLGEALALDWRDVDLRRCHVTFAQTKNGEARGVPLHPEAVAALANLQHRRGAVFRTPAGYPYPPSDEGGGQIKTGFRAAVRRAGIAYTTPHDLRHTWATWHYAANRDLPGLMKLGGWKSERMVLRYAHVNVGQLAQSVGALPALAGAKGVTPPRNRTA